MVPSCILGQGATEKGDGQDSNVASFDVEANSASLFLSFRSQSFMLYAWVGLAQPFTKLFPDKKYDRGPCFVCP